MFYVDGTQLGNSLLFNPLTELPTGGGQGDLRIGINYNRDNPAKLVGAFEGLIDELVIWNEVTTAQFIPPDLPCGLFADVNGSCSLDVNDWIQFRAGQQTDMTGLSAAQAFAKGDLNGDFVLFKTAYEATHGIGSLTTILNVPEPPAAILAALAMSLCAFARTRRRWDRYGIWPARDAAPYS